MRSPSDRSQHHRQLSPCRRQSRRSVLLVLDLTHCVSCRLGARLVVYLYHRRDELGHWRPNRPPLGRLQSL